MNIEREEHTKMRARQIALGLGLILAAGCAGQQVSTDYSPSTGFSQFRTFALVAPPDTAGQQLLDQRVRNAVQAQLDSKGLTAADRQHADLFVGYGMVDKTHKEVYTYRDGWGWGGGWGWRYWRWGVAWPMTVQRRVETYTDGTVVVNLIDAKTKQVVWEGEVGDAVNLPVTNPVRATQQIDAAVAKLFTKYPPQSSGA
jgi:Domain of unknown function (DUF4136)